MKQINVSNPQVTTKRLINALERESEGEARALLNTIKKQAYNRQYRLKQKMNDKSYTPIERNIIEKQYKQAKEEYKKVTESVEKIRSSFKNKNQRLTQAVNNLNINLARNEARKEALRELQQEVGDVVGVSTLNVSVNRKIESIFEHYIFNSKGADFNDIDYKYVNDTLKKVLKFDFENAIKEGLVQSKDFASDDIFDMLVTVSRGAEKVVQERATDFTAEEKEELQNAFTILNRKNLL